MCGEHGVIPEFADDFSVISLLGLLVGAVSQAPPLPQRRAHQVLSPCMFTCQKHGYLVFKKDTSCVLTLARGQEKVCTIPQRQRRIYKVSEVSVL